MKRKYRTNEEWATIFKDQKESGLQIRQYCRLNSIPESLFYKRRNIIGNTKQVFLPVEAVDHTDDVKTSSRIVINGIAIEVSDDTSADLLNKVLDKVIRPC